MGRATESTVLRDLRTVFDGGSVAGLGDGPLLERFARRGDDEVAEAAFAVLVERHGPMVLRACRATLRDEHDAEDAFQAVFLVLARKARVLWVRDSLGPWLHSVALRTAAYARSEARRRRDLERRRAESTPLLIDEQARDDPSPLIHEELGKLPDRYRVPLVLCDLEGLSHDEAARQLGWPIGTVKSRQSRGRARLRERLARRGLGTPAGVLGAIDGGKAGATVVPDALRGAAISLGRASGTVPASVAALAERGSLAMLTTRLKGIAAMAALGLVAVGAAVLAQLPGRDLAPKPSPAVPEAPTKAPPRIVSPSPPREPVARLATVIGIDKPGRTIVLQEATIDPADPERPTFVQRHFSAATGHALRADRRPIPEADLWGLLDASPSAGPRTVLVVADERYLGPSPLGVLKGDTIVLVGSRGVDRQGEDDDDFLAFTAKRPARILYLGGPRFSWEPKYLARALGEDPEPQVDLQVLRAAGDGKDADFVPGRYDAYVVADLPAGLLTPGQQDGLAKSVEAGAGLILIGGPSRFEGWDVGPLARLVPAIVGPAARQAGVQEGVHVVPTAAGAGSPILAIGQTPAESARRWAALPPLPPVEQAGPLKPLTHVLATTEGGAPLILALDVGLGRVLAIGSETWPWARGADEARASHRGFWLRALGWACHREVNP